MVLTLSKLDEPLERTAEFEEPEYDIKWGTPTSRITFPFHNQKNVKAIIVIVHDITEQVQENEFDYLDSLGIGYGNIIRSQGLVWDKARHCSFSMH